MKNRMIRMLVVGILALMTAGFAGDARACNAPDNGEGTVDLPADCPYEASEDAITIVDGLPPGTTIIMDGPFQDFFNINRRPGGTLGGEIATFEGSFTWHCTGTGVLAGFERDIIMSADFEIHSGPRDVGGPMQAFPVEMFRLSGELFGDPDFCMLRVSGGTDYGLPSPGGTVLTRLPSGDFAVDSFFDITYQIEFEGCPGSVLEGYAGATYGTVRFSTSTHDLEPGTDCWMALEATVVFGENEPIPADFFGPGSDPFVGEVYLEADFGSETDVNALFTREGALFEETVEIELVELSLKSSEPITVTFNGQPDSFFDVFVDLDPGLPSVGQMNISGDDSGGTFEIPELTVNPVFTFVRVDGGVPLTLQRSIDGMKSAPYAWEDSPMCDTVPPCENNDFYPVGTEPMILSAGEPPDDSLTILLLPHMQVSGEPGERCTAPDNGNGTIDFPPPCPYDDREESVMIIDGLQPGTTLLVDGPLGEFLNIGSTPGGTLGGEIVTFEGSFMWEVTGTGDLTGFQRNLFVPVQCEVHTGPRAPWEPVQSFENEMYTLLGELFGDPDFCTLRISGGTNLGLPSPGETTLSRLPSDDFSVDSFFDITYQIEFQGCPGSILDGLGGTTTGTVRLSTGSTDIDPGIDCWKTFYAETVFGEGTPIPADFFGPGSEPFEGTVSLVADPEDPSTGVDTLVLRTGANLCEPVPIEIVEMSLKSTAPITVTYAEAPDSFFDVFVTLAPDIPSAGEMIIVGEETGGIFGVMNLTANLGFRFLPVGGGPPLELTRSITMIEGGHYGWQNKTYCGCVPPCTGNDFYPTGSGFMMLYGGSESGDEFFAAMTPYSPEVQTLKCTKSGSDIRLQWTPLEGIVAYDILYAESLEIPAVLAEDVGSPWDHTDALAGGAYLYMIEPSCD